LADEVSLPGALIETALARSRDLDAQASFRQIKADQRRAALAEIAALPEGLF
jgi:hypothetical protein